MARIGAATLFGGWTIDKTVLNHCDELENWGNLSAVIYGPGTATNASQPKSDYHTNSSYVKSEARTLGSSLGRPLDTLQPRTIRLAVQVRF